MMLRYQIYLEIASVLGAGSAREAAETVWSNANRPAKELKKAASSD
jgi:hypothetical protein